MPEIVVEEAGPVERGDRVLGIERRLLLVIGLVIVLQAVLFYDHFATALTALFGVGLGLWMRSWTAGLWAAAAFVASFVLAVATQHLEDFRPIAEPLLGVGMAFLGGAIAGGIFDVLRAETAEDRPLIGRTGR